MKVRKLPVVVDAVRWTGENLTEVRGVLDVPDGSMFIRRRPERENGVLVINTLEGEMTANVGDWIVRGVLGEFHPVKQEAFELTYELVEARRDGK